MLVFLAIHNLEVREHPCIYIRYYLGASFNWPSHPMFSNLLASMHFHFVLDFAILLHVDQNRLTISSTYRNEGLPSGRYQSVGYQSTTAWVHLLSVNFATRLVKRNFYFRYPVITFSIPLRSLITLVRMCSHKFLIQNRIIRVRNTWNQLTLCKNWIIGIT